MKSRMDRYYKKDINLKKRVDKNKELYKDFSENVNYSNIEGFTNLKKGEAIDLEQIKKLIDKQENKIEVKTIEQIEIIEEKNYDLKEVLDKAKEESITSTKYDMTKNDKIDEREVDIETFMEEFSSLEGTGLLDELKNTSEIDIVDEKELDKAFYTSTMEFEKKDFEELEENIKKNNFLSIVLIFVLILVLVGIGFIVYYLFM